MNDIPTSTDPSAVLSVAELNRLARQRLESAFPLLRVVGEVSNLSRATSGHLYFTLKDDTAQVRCTMWRNRAQLMPFRPENGMRVELRALVTLYEARGDYQLAVESVRAVGQGDLLEAFLRLRDKLAAEGLFDPAIKRPLPPFPRRIGVVTSPTAAALQDVLACLRRRSPHVEVVVYPAAVQGATAATALCNAVALASRRAAADHIDLLLLVRGGGSIEDLAAFNDEALARAVRACSVPVVSGIGHETDFSISDFVADHRAATPTMAAELASAGYHAATARMDHLASRATTAMQRRLHELNQRVDRSGLRLIHPRDRLERARVDCARLEQGLANAVRRNLTEMRQRVNQADRDLRRAQPRPGPLIEDLARLHKRLEDAMLSDLGQRRSAVATLSSHLCHLGPAAVLRRGYSIVRDGNGDIVRDAATVSLGAAIVVELDRGVLEAEVVGLSAAPSPGLGAT